MIHVELSNPHIKSPRGLPAPGTYSFILQKTGQVWVDPSAIATMAVGSHSEAIVCRVTESIVPEEKGRACFTVFVKSPWTRDFMRNRQAWTDVTKEYPLPGFHPALGSDAQVLLMKMDDAWRIRGWFVNNIDQLSTPGFNAAIKELTRLGLVEVLSDGGPRRWKRASQVMVDAIAEAYGEAQAEQDRIDALDPSSDEAILRTLLSKNVPVIGEVIRTGVHNTRLEALRALEAAGQKRSGVDRAITDQELKMAQVEAALDQRPNPTRPAATQPDGASAMADLAADDDAAAG